MKDIENAFNLEEFTPLMPAVVPPPEDLSGDYDYARENLYSILGTSNMALQQLLTIAAGSQQPRAYEVLTNLMKAMADMNGQLLDLQEKKKNIAAPTEDPNAPKTVNQNLVITTAELSKLISQMKSQDDN